VEWPSKHVADSYPELLLPADEPTPAPQPQQPKTSTGLIVGIVIGVVAGLAALATGVYFIMRARRNKLQPSTKHQMPPPGLAPGQVAKVVDDIEAGVTGHQTHQMEPGRVAVLRQ
jgi:hypothetical protein